jgi:formamidopyrimidine-DNA glycosylase
MPELPEVETVVRGLAPRLIDRRISDVQALSPSSFWIDAIRASNDRDIAAIKAAVVGKNIQSITRRGKLIIVHISDETRLLIHLKMTGQLIHISSEQPALAGGHPSSDMVGYLPGRSTRGVFEMDDSSRLFFNDQRRFGYIKLATAQMVDEQILPRFGIEPLDAAWNEQSLRSILAKRPKSSIKAVLLDQSLIAGIGNIYADEALFLAGIYPGALAGELSSAQVQLLTETSKEVLLLGIRHGGTSSQHFVQADGAQGSMQEHLLVYRRTGFACLKCGHAIERTVVAGRGTHFCPYCQPKA